MKRVMDFFVYLVIRLFFAKLRLLPRGAARALCRSIATLVYHLDGKHRRVGLINLGIAFPEQDLDWRKRRLLGSFRQLGDLAVEIARLPALTRESAERRVSYEPGRGLENYRGAKEVKGAVIFVTAHISVWELLPAAHALLGNPLSYVVRPLDNLYLERWIASLRARFGNRSVPKARAMRQALKILRDSGDVGFLIDQNVQEKDGVFVPFFGRPAATTAAVARLALRTGLPIVAGFIYPAGPSFEYRIRFYPPLFADPGGHGSDEVLRVTEQLNRHIEEVIREFPECWLWGHRRFQSQPSGEDLYARG